MNKKQIMILILFLTVNYYICYYIFINRSSEGKTSFYPLYSHSESNVKNDFNLTISLNSRILTWDSILNLKVSLKNLTSGEAIPGSYIGIKAFVRTTVLIKVNISIEYYLLNEYVNIENGTIIINKFIPHVPTQVPYTLEITYNIPESNEKLTSSCYFLILSQREPMIPFLTFEMLILFYLLILFVFTIFIFINEKKSKKNSKEKK